MTTNAKRTILGLLLLAVGTTVLLRAMDRVSDPHDEAAELHERVEIVVNERHQHADRQERTERRVDVVVRSEVAVQSDEVMLEERFKVSPGGELNIRVAHSKVRIETSATNEAHIQIRLAAKDMDRAREYFEAQHFSIEQSGNQVIVKSDPERRNWSWNRNGRAKIEVIAHIPTQFDADLTSSHGDVHLANLEGRLAIQTSHGNVHTESIQGPSVSLRTSHGNVHAEAFSSDEIRIQTSHGNVDLGEMTGQWLNIDTSHGNIEVRRATGQVEMSNSHGNINVTLDDLTEAKLRTSHGNLTITAPARLAADLDLKASKVQIASGFSFKGELKKDQADGQLNGGGAQVYARTTHGTIKLTNQ